MYYSYHGGGTCSVTEKNQYRLLSQIEQERERARDERVRAQLSGRTVHRAESYLVALATRQLSCGWVGRWNDGVPRAVLCGVVVRGLLCCVCSSCLFVLVHRANVKVYHFFQFLEARRSVTRGGLLLL